MKQFLLSVLEVAEIAIVAVGGVFLIRAFLIQPFLVSGASMVPNFQNGDYLLIDEISYHFRAPERGEVLVFRYPNDRSTYFIKRIVGLPGERVVVKDGEVQIFNDTHPDGFVLKEDYLPVDTKTPGSVSYTLGPNQYFMLGDNRSYSFDSRYWGLLDSPDIVGLVRLRLWPPLDFTVFSAPQYSY